MPIYEYRCRRCGQDFEQYVPAARASVACPSCEGRDVTRKLSVFGLKTSGEVVPSMPAGGSSCCGGGCGCS